MARGDWIDAGSSSLSSRSGAKQGFYYRYSNTLEDAITDNKDIIQVIPYGFRTGTGTTAYAYTTLTSSFTYKIGSNTAVSTSMGTQYDYSDATTVNKIYYFTSSTPFKRMSGATLLSSVNGKTGYGFTFENPHNEDGTSNAVIMTWFFNGSDSHGDATKSITITPDAIPRGSTLGEIADFELDSSFAINITKHVSSYTDDLVIKVKGTTIKTYSGISNGDTISFTSTEQTTIKGLVSTPQIPIVFELSSYNGSVQVGTTSTQTAIVTTLSSSILDSWSKKSNGHYQYAINGLVDDTIDDVFQVYDDEGNRVYDDNKTMIKLIGKTLSTGILSAGAKGYYTLSMTIPTGYTAIGAQINSNQIANLGGAQFTPIFNHIGTTGAQTIYVLYYAPTAINPAKNFEVIITCILTDYYNYTSQD